MQQKLCRGCGQTKPLSDFSVCKRDGHQSRCKVCKLAWRNSPTGKAAAARGNHNWALSEKGKASLARAHKKYVEREGAAVARRARARAPEKVKARSLARAVRAAAPRVCAELSPDCKGRVEAHHHHGYAAANARDVVLLCAHHHRAAEGTSRSPGKHPSRKEKLTKAQVAEVVAMRADGHKFTTIAERFGVSPSHASCLVRGLRRASGEIK